MYYMYTRWSAVAGFWRPIIIMVIYGYNIIAVGRRSTEERGYNNI